LDKAHKMESVHNAFLHKIFFSVPTELTTDQLLLNMKKYMFTKEKKEKIEYDGNRHNSHHSPLNSICENEPRKRRRDNSNLCVSHPSIAFHVNNTDGLDGLDTNMLIQKELDTVGNVHTNLANNETGKTYTPDKQFNHMINPQKSGAVNTLFWCVYIAIHGYTDFSVLDPLSAKQTSLHGENSLFIENTNTISSLKKSMKNMKSLKRPIDIQNAFKGIKREMEIKQDMLDKFMKKPTLLKTGNHKMTNVAIDEYCADLQIKKKDDLHSLVGFSIYYGVDIIVVCHSRSFYIEFSGSPKEEKIKGESGMECLPIVIIYDEKEKVFLLDTENGRMNDKRDYKLCNENGDGDSKSAQEKKENKIKEWKNKYLCLENYKKPLKGVSGYKVADLEIMMDKLGLVCKAGAKKQDMYDAIQQHLLCVIPDLCGLC
jgi:hypothetical protein